MEISSDYPCFDCVKYSCFEIHELTNNCVAIKLNSSTVDNIYFPCLFILKYPSPSV